MSAISWAAAIAALTVTALPEATARHHPHHRHHWVDTLSDVDPTTLLSSAQRTGASAPREPLSAHVGKEALPTNAWWQSMALQDAGTQNSNIFQMPYTIIASPSTLDVYNPFLIPGGNNFLQSYPQTSGIQLGVTAAGGAGQMAINSWDELSVEVGWSSLGMRAPLFRGSPYVTMVYDEVTPAVSAKEALATASVMVDGVSTPCGVAPIVSPVGGSITAHMGPSDSIWAIYAPAGTEWTCEPTPFTLAAMKPMTGAVRLALVNNCTTGTGPHHCHPLPGPIWAGAHNATEWHTLLDAHADTIPVSSSVSWSINDGVEARDLDFAQGMSTASLTLNFEVASLSSPAHHHHKAAPLMLYWPGHAQAFDATTSAAAASVKASSPEFRSVRGVAHPIVASSWVLQTTALPNSGFAAPRPLADGFAETIATIITSDPAKYNGSHSDSDYDLPENYIIGAGDTYFSGKMLARLARITEVANEVAQQVPTAKAAAAKLLARLEARMETWMNGKGEAPFIYDSTWRGVISCGCMYSGGHCTGHDNPSAQACPSLTNSGLNFGNGWYNDHHFHYGYFMYAGAVAAALDPAWGARWKENLLLFARDVANPTEADTYFPKARHFDFFLGFSFAGGLPGAYANGRNQESSSEAIHGYYGASMLGYALNVKQLDTFGRVLAAFESHGSNVYWHAAMSPEIYGPNGSLYPQPVVGILWSDQTSFSTWFGADPYLVHGIQILPVSVASELTQTPAWAKVDNAALSKACDTSPTSGCTTAGWSWLVCLQQAVLDTASALACVDQLPANAFSSANAGSNGNSLTNSLHWIGTRVAAQQQQQQQQEVQVVV